MRPPVAHARAVDAAIFGSALLLAGALKHYAGNAHADQLSFLLRPTVCLVELLTGTRFEDEGAAGYLDRDHGYVIIAACAGVNFLVVAFASLLAHAPRLRRAWQKVVLLLAAAGGAYALTIVANATRLILALALHNHRAAWGWFTPARLHETVGAAIYLIVLLLASAVTTRAIDRRSATLAAERGA
jgi:exosortase K